MNAICVTCGTQFAETAGFPKNCPICEDERQFVGLEGQEWTTLDQLRCGHRTAITREEPDITSFAIEPHFGIGQRALFIQTEAGNLLWDSISLIDNAALSYIQAMGGVQAIAISHPHYYTSMVEWSRHFGGVPIYLHQDDAQWVMRPSDLISFWSGEAKPLFGGLTAIRCGGHFPGGTVLHFPSGASSKGVVLSGDVIQVTPDLRSVSFMWSYPNFIPLGPAQIERIVSAVEPYDFDRIYGAFPKRTIQSGAKTIIRCSAERYLKQILNSAPSPVSLRA